MRIRASVQSMLSGTRLNELPLMYHWLLQNSSDQVLFDLESTEAFQYFDPVAESTSYKITCEMLNDSRVVINTLYADVITPSSITVENVPTAALRVIYEN